MVLICPVDFSSRTGPRPVPLPLSPSSALSVGGDSHRPRAPATHGGCSTSSCASSSPPPTAWPPPPSSSLGPPFSPPRSVSLPAPVIPSERQRRSSEEALGTANSIAVANSPAAAA
ncbi:hypothetical protein VPH35_013227 [Triticum aestivum]